MHADADTTAPAVTDLTAIERQGLSARFFLGNDPAAPADVTADSVPALSYSPTATVGGAITAGDTLTTTINGVAISYQAGAADTTLAQLAGNIAAAINQATAVDPGTGLPIGKLVAATVSGSVITITGTDPSGAHSLLHPRGLRLGRGDGNLHRGQPAPGRHRRRAGRRRLERLHHRGAGRRLRHQRGHRPGRGGDPRGRRRPGPRPGGRQPLAEPGAGLARGRPAHPRHADGHLAADHALGQLAGHRPRLAAHPGPVPVLRHAGHPAERYLHPVPQGRLAGGRPVADRGGNSRTSRHPSRRPRAAAGSTT